MIKFLDFLFEKEDDEEKITTVEVANDVVVQTKELDESMVENVSLEFSMDDEPQKWTDVDHILEEFQEKPKQVKKQKIQTQPYVFTESISPIFGMKEKKSKETKVASGQKVVMHHTNPSKIGTVLSPIYGVDVFDDEEVDILTDSLSSESLKSEEVNLNVNHHRIGFVQESLFSTRDEEEKEYIANETLASLIKNNEIDTSKKVLDFDEDDTI